MAGAGGPLPPPLNRLGTYASLAQNDPPPIAALKHKLLLVAIGKSPRFRNDLDLVVITQYFATLESLAHVSPHALHYLATECTAMTLRDGDVFCYQEDSIVTDSNALIIIEGSLCGYFNKPFSQRHNPTELFTTWNARQNRKRGVLVDFGDFQTTYAAGALCGFEDLLHGIPTAAATTGDVSWYRRKGIHAQEQTRAISVTKDTLGRAAHRFRLVVERGILHCPREAASTDISHLAIFSAFSESTRQALLQHAPRRRVLCGDTLFGSTRTDSTIAPITTAIHAVAIVLSGRLDMYWTGDVETSDVLDGEASADPATSTHPLVSIRRGQTIGDQTLGLALGQLVDAFGHTLNRLPIRIVSADDTTEVVWIPHALYHEKRTEDHTLQDYAAQLNHQRLVTPSSFFTAWAPAYFAAKTPAERSLPDLQQLVWRLRHDSVVAKCCFQFPPLVLERLCHAMELVQFDDDTALVLAANSDSDEVYVVVQGALRGELLADGGTQDVYLPGDLFGLATCHPATSVYADAGTMLLTVPRTCFERWLQPVKDQLITNAGTLFHRHALYTVAHSPRQSPSPDKRKSLTAQARRASAQTASSADDHGGDHHHKDDAHHTEALATLLQRMGFLKAVPHFMLCKLLLQCTLIHKPPGEFLCHENDAVTSLVVVLSGFLRVYSMDHMGETLDMFRDHTFCQFASLHDVLTRHTLHDLAPPSAGIRHEASGVIGVLTRHRSPMLGIHLQTLHAHNAFRLGVLHNHTQCPATIVAQTPCTLLLVDEAAYTAILNKHAPAIDMVHYHLMTTATLFSDPPPHTTTVSIHQRAYQATLVPQPLLCNLEACASSSSLAWLTQLPPAKRQLLLREAKLLVLQPGDRLVRHGESVDHVFVVVRGALALYVRTHHDRVADALHASQRSVRSLLLERTVTSNYATTSHQLHALDGGLTRGGADPRRLQHKRAMLQHKVHNHLKATTADAVEGVAQPGSLVLQSVVAAVRADKRPCESATARVLHAVVDRVTHTHRLDQRRHGDALAPVQTAVTSQPVEDDRVDDTADTSRGSTLLLCHLHAGDVYGDEALSSIVYRSPHDVFAEASSVTTSAASAAALPIELLCLDRVAFLSILHKSDDDVNMNLRGRAHAAKTKWRQVEQHVLLQAQRTTPTTNKTPKLFDLFQNILNQRYFLTMRALAAMPLLQDLSDSVKRALCTGARFEAIERFSNVYKDDARTSSSTTTTTTATGAATTQSSSVSPHRYYFVLSGRIGLFAKSALHGNQGTAALASSSGGSAGPAKHSAMAPSASSASSSLPAVNATSHHYMNLASSMDACLHEVSVGAGFGEFEVLVREASRHHMVALALEPTTLLSLPGKLFVAHWPQVPAMQRHIACLRSGAVRFLARLEMEKIASVYHALRDETYTRGARILEQQQPVHKSEVVFLTHGECSIQTTLTVQTLAQDYPDTDENKHHETDRPRPQHAMRVLATIADVRTGHVFWLDGPGRVPLTLQAISSHVTVARIRVDKLCAILPKAHFAELEKCSDALAALYREQLTTARRMVVRLLNDKRHAELGRRSSKDDEAVALLPSLHYTLQASSKNTQLQSRVATGDSVRTRVGVETN